MPEPPDLPAPPPPAPGPEFVHNPVPARRPRGRVLTAVGVAVAVLAGALVVLFTRGGPGGGPDVALALAYRKGAVYGFRMSIGLDATLSVAGRSVHVSGTARGPASIRVVRTSTGHPATVVLEVGPLAAATNGRQQTIPARSIRMK